MSDLIIKPSAGQGNKLILQDQAGGVILTTADSGAVIANTSVAGTDLTGNSLGVTAANDTAATLFIKADNSDDAGDDWTVVSNTNQTLTIENDIASAGTGVAMLTITPHATAASSAVAVAGGLTVAGDVTIDANQWIRVGGQYALSGDGSGNTFLDNGGGYLSFRKVGTELMKLDSSGLIIGVGVVEKIGTGSVSGTTATVDLATGNFFVFDLQSASGTVATFTVNNTNATANQLSNFIVKVIQGSTDREFTWGGLTAFKWPAATAPTLTTGNDKVDILSFTTYDNGTTWYGQLVGQDFS